MGSKNNPKNRGHESAKKIYQGKELEPVIFVGSSKGATGQYMAAKYAKTSDLVLDANGTPMRWDDIISE